MDFQNQFPNTYVPREQQKKLISDIESMIKSGYKNILVCAPTGIGKSHVAATVARSLGSSIIITAQKILQDQYIEDFSWLHPIKGKSNFPCMSLYVPMNVNYNDAIKKKNLLCDKGDCSWVEKDENGNKKIAYCKYKPMIDQLVCHEKGTENENIRFPDDKCHYYIQKYAGLLSSHTIFNYSSFFQTKKFDYGIESHLKRNCVIADEAHEIEDQLINFIGFELIPSYFDDLQTKFPDVIIAEPELMLSTLVELYEKYSNMVSKLEESKLTEKIVIYKNRLQKLDQIKSQIELNPDNFIIENKINPFGKLTSFSIKPLEIRDYINQYFNYDIQLFMSATLNKEMFCNTMGFIEDETAFIEIEKSPFPTENRTIKFLNVASLSGTPSSNKLNDIYKMIDDLMKKHLGQKGLILTSSKKSCEQIFMGVSEESSLRLSVLHSDTEDEKEKILADHEKQNGDVLLSPSLWYGIDLKDDLSRFQIVVKTPYLSLADKRTKMKLAKNPTWYKYMTLVKLLQGFGRSIRSETDYAITYVLDSEAVKLINDMKEYVPKSYYDILEWN